MNKQISLSTVLTFLLISIFFLISSSLGFFDGVISLTSKVKGNFMLSIHSKFNFLSDLVSTYHYINDVKDENEDLKKKLIVVQSKLVNTQNLLDDQIAYCGQMQQSFARDYTTIPAEILRYDPDKYGVVYLNKGEIDGVKIGDNIVIENYLLGKITNTYKYTSVAELISFPKTKVAVISNKGARGVLVPKNGNDFEVQEVLIDADVSIKDTFVTLGVNDGFIPGLYVGSVDKIDSVSSDTKKIISLHNELEFNKLQKVFILNNEDFNN